MNKYMQLLIIGMLFYSADVTATFRSRMASKKNHVPQSVNEAERAQKWEADMEQRFFNTVKETVCQTLNAYLEKDNTQTCKSIQIALEDRQNKTLKALEMQQIKTLQALKTEQNKRLKAFEQWCSSAIQSHESAAQALLAKAQATAHVKTVAVRKPVCFEPVQVSPTVVPETNNTCVDTNTAMVVSDTHSVPETQVTIVAPEISMTQALPVVPSTVAIGKH